MNLRSRQAATLFALVISLVAPQVPSAAAFDLTGCSSQNTGTDHLVIDEIYNSLGKCHDTCLSQFAFGIVQGESCWCSNYAPGDTVDTSQCDTPCPGWPYEFCASTDSGLFGYIALSKSPLGTSSTAAPSESTAPPSSSPVVTSVVTSTTIVRLSTPGGSASLPRQSLAGPSSSTNLAQSSPSTAAASSDAPAPTAVVVPVLSVKTVLGQAQTVTLSATAEPLPAETQPPLPSSESTDTNSFWSNTGKVAGTFTVVGLVIAALIGTAIFFFFRHRRRDMDAMTVASNEDQPTSSNGAPYMVDRRRSNLTLATGGLAGLTRGSSHEKSPVDNKTPASLSRRGSIPMGHDQRLNPAALLNTAHPNGSHTSVNTFQDDRDYSRPVLHIRNPDMG